MARFRLIPGEEKFYTDFLALADQIVAAAVLDAMLATETPDWEAAFQIHDIEHACDGITHAIIQRFNRTFVTPIDREGIHELARSLDDVTDAIDAAATVIRRYRVAPVRYGARELATIIARSTHQVRMAVDALERKHGVHERAVEVNRLENEADRRQDRVGLDPDDSRVVCHRDRHLLDAGPRVVVSATEPRRPRSRIGHGGTEGTEDFRGIARISGMFLGCPSAS